MFSIFDFFGWTGAALFILAYWLLEIKRMKEDSVSYLLLNLIGGIFVAAETYIHQSYGGFALNAVWALISIYGLVMVASGNRKPKRK